MTASESLELLLKIDRLVDEAQDESQLALNLTSLYAQAFSADLTLMAQPSGGPDGKLHPQAILDRAALFDRIPEEKLAQFLMESAAPAAGAVRVSTLTAGDEPLHTLTAALRSHGDLLGIMLASRRKKPFSNREIELFTTAAALLDNALRAWVNLRRSQQESQALRAIMRIDRIRDSSVSMEDLLDRSLAELIRVVPAAIGFILLYDRSGNRLELRAVTDSEFLAQTGPLQQVYAAADEAIQTGLPVHHLYNDGPLRALLGIPLILNNRVIGVLGLLNRWRVGGFSNSDRRLLQAIASQMDTAIFERLQSQRLRETFGRSVGPRVMDRLLQIDDRDLLKGERVDIATLFSDIRDFTAASGPLEPARLEFMIDIHLDAMTGVILEYEGTLDKYIGDGVMAIFNAPERQPDFAQRAIKTALAMQRAHAQVMERWRAEGLPAQPIGIGVTVGEAIVGSFGSQAHAEYSAIGSCVNLASRLCGAALGGQILIDEDTRARLASEIITVPVGPLDLKGYANPVPAYEVRGLKGFE